MWDTGNHIPFRENTKKLHLSKRQTNLLFSFGIAIPKGFWERENKFLFCVSVYCLETCIEGIFNNKKYTKKSKEKKKGATVVEEKLKENIE